MRRTTIALMLAFAPGYLAAQSQDPGQTGSGEPATQSSEGAPALSGFSAETRVRLEAMLRVAREHNVPTEPMNNRIAEGQAKGAGEAQIIAATRQVQAELFASQQALIRAGREQPSAAEIERGAQVIARGASRAQLEAFVRQTPSERLDVALESLGELAARGIPVDRALEAIASAQFNGSAGGQAGVGIGREAVGSSVAGGVTGKLGIGLTRRP